MKGNREADVNVIFQYFPFCDCFLQNTGCVYHANKVIQLKRENPIMNANCLIFSS